jgi:hypothetical protein
MRWCRHLHNAMAMVRPRETLSPANPAFRAVDSKTSRLGHCRLCPCGRPKVLQRRSKDTPADSAVSGGGYLHGGCRSGDNRGDVWHRMAFKLLSRRAS